MQSLKAALQHTVLVLLVGGFLARARADVPSCPRPVDGSVCVYNPTARICECTFTIVPTQPTGGGGADPILTDFTGHTFEFLGEPHGFYNLYSDRAHQVTMGLIPGFVDGHNGTYMDRFGLAFHGIQAQVTLADQEGDIQVQTGQLGAAERHETLVSGKEVNYVLSQSNGISLHVFTEPFRPFTGKTVEISSDVVKLSIWSVPAGEVDTLNVTQPAYLNFNVTLLAPPVGDEAEGIIGESLVRLTAGGLSTANAASTNKTDMPGFEGKGKTADYAVSSIFAADFPFNRYKIDHSTSTARRAMKSSPFAMLSFPCTATSARVA